MVDSAHLTPNTKALAAKKGQWAKDNRPRFFRWLRVGCWPESRAVQVSQGYTNDGMPRSPWGIPHLQARTNARHWMPVSAPSRVPRQQSLGSRCRLSSTAAVARLKYPSVPCLVGSPIKVFRRENDSLAGLSLAG